MIKGLESVSTILEDYVENSLCINGKTKHLALCARSVLLVHVKWSKDPTTVSVTWSDYANCPKSMQQVNGFQAFQKIPGGGAMNTKRQQSKRKALSQNYCLELAIRYLRLGRTYQYRSMHWCGYTTYLSLLCVESCNKNGSKYYTRLKNCKIGLNFATAK